MPRGTFGNSRQVFKGDNLRKMGQFFSRVNFNVCISRGKLKVRRFQGWRKMIWGTLFCTCPFGKLSKRPGVSFAHIQPAKKSLVSQRKPICNNNRTELMRGDKTSALHLVIIIPLVVNIRIVQCKQIIMSIRINDGIHLLHCYYLPSHVNQCL